MFTEDVPNAVEESLEHGNILVALILGLIAIFVSLRNAMTRSIRNEELLKRIDKELHPNGGNSLRDSVNNIERGYTDLVNRVDDLTRHVLSMSSVRETLGDTPGPEKMTKWHYPTETDYVRGSE